MASKQDKNAVVAEILTTLGVGTGAAVATAAGAPLIAVTIGTAIVSGLLKFIISEATNHPKLEGIVASIRNRRTAITVEMIREALLIVTNLKPEYKEPIDELADVVSDPEGKRDNQRFLEALKKLFAVVMQTTPLLEGIKEDTQFIPQILNNTTELRDSVERIEAAVCNPATQASPSHDGYTAIRLESLSSELRDLHDEEGQKKWQAIHKALENHSWRLVVDLMDDMECWLDKQGEKISPEIKGQTLLTLTDVTLIRDSGGPYKKGAKTDNAWRLLKRAEDVFGATPSGENAQKLLRVRTKLLFLDNKHEEAFSLIEQTSGPKSVSLQIAMLGELDRWEEASDVALSEQEYHDKWCDDAIVAHIRARRDKAADETLKWAQQQDNPTLSIRCILAYCREHYSHITQQGSSKTIALLGNAEKKQLEDLRIKLKDAISEATRPAGPQSGLEVEILELAILLGHALVDREACQVAAQALVKWKPVSFELAHAVLRDDMPCIDGLAERVLDEYPDVLRAKQLAAVLYTDKMEQHDKALSILLELSQHIEDMGQKIEVCSSLLIAAQNCLDEQLEDALQAISTLLGKDHRLASMLRSICFVRSGDLESASTELNKAKDERDYIWLQFAGGLAVQQEDWPLAAERFHKAATLTGHFKAFLDEAFAWHKADETEKTVEALEQAHRLDPYRDSTIYNLAVSYHQLGKHADAAKMYAKLWDKQTTNEQLVMNYASCLALSGQTDQAVAILDSICEQNGMNCEPILMRAHLLLGQGKPEEALKALLPFWDSYQDDHRYLLAMLQMGYAAGEESEANKAFARLLKIQKSGKLPEGVIEQHSLDDLLEMNSHWQKRKESINQKYLRGHIPWIIASHWILPSGHAYLSWRNRTQDLVPVDHPDSLAEHSIYATNGFTVGELNDQRWLVRLRAPTNNTSVVADISALITLHRLGLLEELSRCFKRILVPSSYPAFWLKEQAHISHHQPSQIRSREAIAEAARRGVIEVVCGDFRDRETLVLDEYEKSPSEGNTAVRILQVAEWLRRKGKLSNKEYQRVAKANNEASRVDDKKVAATLDTGRLNAKVFTLQTLHNLGVLKSLMSALRLSIQDCELKTLEAELAENRACEQTGEWHRELINIFEHIDAVEFIEQADKEPQEKEHTDIHYGLDATLLAVKEKLPLLVDDRYCQQGRLAASPLHPEKAFGTDVLLEKMAETGLIDAKTHTDCFLKLIRWRYKFLLPPVSVLLTIANRFKEGIPGAEMQEIAVYVHDCMRDLGLYGGPEQVDPPASMALRLFKSWIDTIAEFCVEIWWDDRFSEQQAACFTKWIAQYCIPYYPKNLGVPASQGAYRIATNTLVSGVAQHCLFKDDPKRANRIINRIRRALRFSQGDIASICEQFSRSVLAVTKQTGEDAARQDYLRVLDIFLGCFPQINWRFLPTAEALGIVTRTPTQELDETILKDITESRLPPVKGPFAFIQDNEKVTVFFLPDLLLAENADMRQVVLKDIEPEEHCPKTPHTIAVIQEYRDQVACKSASDWGPATTRIIETLQDDFLLNLAGFGQTQEHNFANGLNRCWQKIIRPTIEALLSIPYDGWSLITNSEDTSHQFAKIRKESRDLATLVEEYERLAGHLALAKPLDLGTQIHLYLSKRKKTKDVWEVFEPWLNDQGRPWRRYHACQALLANPETVSQGRLQELWTAVCQITSLLKADEINSETSQVWRLQAELAAHYLRVVELAEVPLHPARPLTVAWWAATQVTNILTRHVKPESLPAQIKQWRNEPLSQNTMFTHDSWTLLSPQEYSPTRFATLYSSSPLSLGLLCEVGHYAATQGLESVPAEYRTKLRDCFQTVLLTENSQDIGEQDGNWVWDSSLLTSACTFIEALPSDERIDETTQILEVVKRFSDANAVGEAINQLLAMNEIDTVFLASRIRLACYTQSETANLILDKLRDEHWRSKCAQKLPLMAWELLASGCLFLQAKEGLSWQVEMPYIWLRCAEAALDNPDRSHFFLMLLIMSSLSGRTVGAIKLLTKSKKLPELQNSLQKIFEKLEALRDAGEPSISPRFREICALLEKYRAKPFRSEKHFRENNSQ